MSGALHLKRLAIGHRREALHSLEIFSEDGLGWKFQSVAYFLDGHRSGGQAALGVEDYIFFNPL